MKVIDLFCGAGGFSHGFQTEGFDIILGVDNWKGCMETYMHNHPKTDFLLMDINELDPSILPKADVVIGSPPCTNFSVVNPHKDESKGFVLIDKFLEIIEACEPAYWIMENVPNKHLIDHLNGFPYMVVRCSDYGLRTMRRRLFAGQFPQPFSMGWRDWRYESSGTVYPSVGTTQPSGFIKHSDDRMFYLREPWENRNVVFPSVNTKDPYTQSKKTDWKRRGVEIREFTPEFAAWVQTFPDDFKFIGSKTSKYKMIGNAVPPEMSRILARAIKEDYEIRT